MNAFASRHAIIIGGGASGVLLAYQLLQRSTPDFRITLIEKRPEIGRGLAYHTGNPEHVLNVRVANMSALPDEPDHFWRWLTSREGVPPPCPDPYCFVPRRIYGDYIANLLMTSKGRSSHRLSIIQGTCVDVSEGPSEVTVRLDDGRCYIGDIAVLATGHDVRSCSQGYADPWVLPSASGIDPDATILILGTGLTMVDYVQSVIQDGHRGPIVAMSRRGLLTKPPTAASIRFASRKRTCRSAPASASCCAGSVAGLTHTSSRAATGAVLSTAFGPTLNGSGASFRLPPNADSSNTRALGGTCIVIAWRPR
jgi:uncharacterized NAD(P)/FAD-binding protein YdhS